MKIIDLSHLIEHRGIGHPRHPRPMVWTWITHEETRKELGTGPNGHASTVKVVQMTDHTGTHVDAPLHFDASPGALSIDQMPLENFFGPAVCLDLSRIPPKGHITSKDLEEAWRRTGTAMEPNLIVLIHTGHAHRTFGSPEYFTDFPGLTPEAVECLGKQGVKNFGVEAINPGHPDDREFLVHVMCRKMGMIHMENLVNLEKLVGKGRFTFIAFPLKIKGGGGSPVRAVAILDE
ncbi:MAG: cyclase family protein [candidate division Zixibacteria bacterium]|nr:cyclase family protein [candidate division Zixibacteria bacterium]